MYIDVFKVFCDLAETGSFSKAAAVNGVTQKTLKTSIYMPRYRTDKRPLSPCQRESSR